MTHPKHGLDAKTAIRPSQGTGWRSGDRSDEGSARRASRIGPGGLGVVLVFLLILPDLLDGLPGGGADAPGGSGGGP